MIGWIILNYKQMLLLEVLLNNMVVDWNVHIHFIMDGVLCSGDFRKAQSDHFDGENIIFRKSY